MVLIVSILSTLTIGIGIYGLASPTGMRSFVSRFGSKAGFWTAVVLRLVFGVALWRVAPVSRMPAVLEVLGVLSSASAIALLLLGAPRLQVLVSWWSRQSGVVVRAWSAAAVALGASILWSVT
jgi:hypothetical protein